MLWGWRRGIGWGEGGKGAGKGPAEEGDTGRTQFVDQNERDPGAFPNTAVAIFGLARLWAHQVKTSVMFRAYLLNVIRKLVPLFLVTLLE
jgi:hypothetical protein